MMTGVKGYMDIRNTNCIAFELSARQFTGVMNTGDMLRDDFSRPNCDSARRFIDP
jgi:hypothetical protein